MNRIHIRCPRVLTWLLLLLVTLAGCNFFVSGKKPANSVGLAYLPDEPPYSYSFVVVGDTHGKSEFVQAIRGKEKDAEFIVHLGDFTPSGTKDQYLTFLQAVRSMEMPVFVVPGNHDVKHNGAAWFKKFFGPANYSFSIGKMKYVFCDTSSMDIDSKTLAWLAGELSGKETKLLFMHVPPVDPRGKGHCLINEKNSQKLLQLIKQHQVKAVFTGHIHYYGETALGQTKLYVTGGGGGPLYAAKTQGGFHHYLRVKVTGGKIEVTPVALDIPPVSGELAVQGEKEITLTLSGLQAMNTVKGVSSFENKFGNVAGKGSYCGVPVSSLVEAVGGMKRDDTLVVYSADGFNQKYSYTNVYPAGANLKRQGTMALAYSYNGNVVPEWEEGYRIVFLPEDQLYSNDDCAATSAPGQGWHVYRSAGARWVRNVNRIEVIPCNQRNN